MKTTSNETIDVEPSQLNRMIREAITEGLTALIVEAVHERLEYMQGRVR